jgi:hypothetical protein
MTTYVVPDLTGEGHHARVDVSDEQAQRFGSMLTALVADGVARFGSVERFQAALERYNAES